MTRQRRSSRDGRATTPSQASRSHHPRPRAGDQLIVSALRKGASRQSSPAMTPYSFFLPPAGPVNQDFAPLGGLCGLPRPHRGGTRNGTAISCRAPPCVPWLPLLRDVGRERHARGPYVHDGPPSHDFPLRDAYPLRSGVEQRVWRALLPSCGVPRLFSTLDFLLNSALIKPAAGVSASPAARARIFEKNLSQTRVNRRRPAQL